jgi:hypothetical protein
VQRVVLIIGSSTDAGAVSSLLSEDLDTTAAAPLVPPLCVRPEPQTLIPSRRDRRGTRRMGYHQDGKRYWESPAFYRQLRR